MEDIDYFAKVFIAVFVLVNPLEGIPFFLDRTRSMSNEEKLGIARKASTSVFIILIFSFFFGRFVLQMFGISPAAFTLAGGIIIFLISLSMVLGSKTQSDKSIPENVSSDSSFAIVPLSIPLLAGPGPISSMILYGGSTVSIWQYLLIPVIVLLVSVGVYLSLRAAAPLEKKLKSTGIDVLTKISGILISAIAMEMIHKGAVSLFPILSK